MTNTLSVTTSSHAGNQYVDTVTPLTNAESSSKAKYSSAGAFAPNYAFTSFPAYVSTSQLDSSQTVASNVYSNQQVAIGSQHMTVAASNYVSHSFTGPIMSTQVSRPAITQFNPNYIVVCNDQEQFDAVQKALSKMDTDGENKQKEESANSKIPVTNQMVLQPQDQASINTRNQKGNLGRDITVASDSRPEAIQQEINMNVSSSSDDTGLTDSYVALDVSSPQQRHAQNIVAEQRHVTSTSFVPSKSSILQARAVLSTIKPVETVETLMKEMKIPSCIPPIDTSATASTPDQDTDSIDADLLQLSQSVSQNLESDTSQVQAQSAKLKWISSSKTGASSTKKSTNVTSRKRKSDTNTGAHIHESAEGTVRNNDDGKKQIVSGSSKLDAAKVKVRPTSSQGKSQTQRLVVSKTGDSQRKSNVATTSTEVASVPAAMQSSVTSRETTPAQKILQHMKGQKKIPKTTKDYLRHLCRLQARGNYLWERVVHGQRVRRQREAALRKAIKITYLSGIKNAISKYVHETFANQVDTLINNKLDKEIKKSILEELEKLRQSETLMQQIADSVRCEMEDDVQSSINESLTMEMKGKSFDTWKDDIISGVKSLMTMDKPEIQKTVQDSVLKHASMNLSSWKTKVSQELKDSFNTQTVIDSVFAKCTEYIDNMMAAQESDHLTSTPVKPDAPRPRATQRKPSAAAGGPSGSPSRSLSPVEENTVYEEDIIAVEKNTSEDKQDSRNNPKYKNMVFLQRLIGGQLKVLVNKRSGELTVADKNAALTMCHTYVAQNISRLKTLRPGTKLLVGPFPLKDVASHPVSVARTGASSTRPRDTRSQMQVANKSLFEYGHAQPEGHKATKPIKSTKPAETGLKIRIPKTAISDEPIHGFEEDYYQGDIEDLGLIDKTADQEKDDDSDESAENLPMRTTRSSGANKQTTVKKSVHTSSGNAKSSSNNKNLAQTSATGKGAASTSAKKNAGNSSSSTKQRASSRPAPKADKKKHKTKVAVASDIEDLEDNTETETLDAVNNLIEGANIHEEDSFEMATNLRLLNVPDSESGTSGMPIRVTTASQALIQGITATESTSRESGDDSRESEIAELSDTEDEDPEIVGNDPKPLRCVLSRRHERNFRLSRRNMKHMRNHLPELKAMLRAKYSSAEKSAVNDKMKALGLEPVNVRLTLKIILCL